jgi:HAD superfamily hydrolase (TIGR01549 family)
MSTGEPTQGDRPGAILDVDGTLVDSVYHHALAWHRAMRRCGVVLPVWRIHRHIGMGGDQLVSALCGDDFEAERGAEVREAEAECFEPMIEEVEPLEGARELLEELKRRGHRLVLASSAKEPELEHYLELLEARDLADAWTSSADVDATKPDPDLIQTALEQIGGGPAVMVGDSIWDCKAAGRAGLPVVGVLTGGFGEAELDDAGARPVFESLSALREGLDATPLARW